jgi:hypothetical protein
MPNATRQAARRFSAAGFSIIPIGVNKRPAFPLLPTRQNPRTGKPEPTWEPYHEKAPDEATVSGWYDRANPPGVGIVCGRVSGGLFVLDFEFSDFFDRWRDLVGRKAPGLLPRLPVVRTPGKDKDAVGGGRHVYGRCSARAVNGTALAKITREEAEARTGDAGQVTAVEVKGEGGYVLAPGTPPLCHPKGQTYEHLEGPPPEEAPDLTEVEVDLLLDCARALERAGKERVEHPTTSAGGGLLPGEDFNRRGTWEQALGAGWREERSDAEVSYWCRPGKDSGVSATAGYCRSEKSGPLLYVFSTNAAPLEAGKAYSRFATFATVHYKSDYKAAAAELPRRGYGDPQSGGATAKVTAGAQKPLTEEERADLGRRLDAALEKGAEELFRDKALLEALAELKVADPSEFAATRESLKGKVSVAALEDALKPLVTRRKREAPAAVAQAGEDCYFEHEGAICHRRQTREGPTLVPLCNFTARIVEQAVRDDGAERTLHLAVETRLADGTDLGRAEVPAAQFGAMDWVLRELGPRAIIYAGLATRDHLRVAIQLRSGQVPTRTVYCHTGWREVEGQWVYLHGGGAIGAGGLITDIEVSLPPALSKYRLPAPPQSPAAAVRASLKLLGPARPSSRPRAGGPAPPRPRPSAAGCALAAGNCPPIRTIPRRRDGRPPRQLEEAAARQACPPGPFSSGLVTV